MWHYRFNSEEERKPGGGGTGPTARTPTDAGPPVMDFLYFYKKTEDDFELRHSLRSVEQYAPWVRKVWIYGDRPDFLTADTSVVEVVPHSFAAAVLGLEPPVRNFFLKFFQSALIPELSPEFVWCCDDYFLLKDYPVEEARKVWYLEDMRNMNRPTRPRLWKSQLWGTHDALTRMGYPEFNFETHTPIYLTKRWVLNAFCDLRDLVTSDVWFGLMGLSSILNHAVRHDKIQIHSLSEDGGRVGWYGELKVSYEEVVDATAGKSFLFLGEGSLTDVTRRFLSTRFPERSRFEADEPAAEPAGEGESR